MGNLAPGDHHPPGLNRTAPGEAAHLLCQWLVVQELTYSMLPVCGPIL